MSGSTSGRSSRSGPNFDNGIDLAFDGAERPAPRLARRSHPGPGSHRLGVGRSASDPEPARRQRGRAVADVADAVPAGDDGRAQPAASGAAGGVHERLAAGRDRERLQLDRLRHPPRAGADAGGAADGRAGEAVLAAAHRSADRGEPGAAREGGAGPVARQRQHGAVEGVPRRHPGDDRRQLGGRPAFDAGALPVPRRGRRLSAVGRRRGRSGGAGRSADAHLLLAAQGVPRLDADDQGACRGSSGNTRRPTSGATSCPARTAAR